jgi:hypothetical protein
MTHNFVYKVNLGEVFSVIIDEVSEDSYAKVSIDLGGDDSFLVTSAEDIDAIVALLQMSKMLVFGENSRLTPGQDM